jgi:BirA family transcriptional regulator, biotin operon repressor / biotin---[acetyl-CoA-carboxylase] ligase
VFAKVKPNTQIIGQNIIYFNQVNSTNKFALELIRQNMADNGTVILAEYQSEGKGQFGREWKSNPFENLMFSIIIKHVTNAPANPFIINKTVTLAMYQCISRILPHSDIRIKWPNDIYADKRKISGILVENNFSGQQLNYSIIGIGLNVNQDFEAEQTLNATSLKAKTDAIIDREALLKDILEQVEENYMLMKTDSDEIEALFDANLFGYREACEFEINHQVQEATIIGCDTNGRLVLDLNGHRHAYLHGEIKQVIYA